MSCVPFLFPSPPFHEAILTHLVVISKDKSSAGKDTDHTDPSSLVTGYTVPKASMLSHFLNETKKESYFTGLLDGGDARRGSGGPKL